MELRQLRYFVAVAEELHFSRAAARLHLAQSALSAQIRGLEDELGATLLRRTSRRVTLTPTGEALLEDARDLLAAADAALARARSSARQMPAELVLGCLGPALGDVLGPLLARLRVAHPSLRVVVRAFGFGELLPALREWEADVVFGYLPYAPSEVADLEVLELRTEPRCAVLSSSHPLAGRAALRPRDLAGEVFVSHPPSVSRTWRDFWLLALELGRRPAVSDRTVATLDDWLLAMAAGAGVDTAPAIVAAAYSWPGVTCVPLLDAQPATLAALRLRSRRDAATGEVMRLLRAMDTSAPLVI